MSLGIGLEIRLGSGGGQSELLPAQTNLHTWLRAGYGYTLNGAGVATWTSQDLTNRTFSQGTAASQPTYSAGDSNYNGQDAVLFDGSDDFLLSDDAVGEWEFLHNGTGASIYVVWRKTADPDTFARVLDTLGAATTGLGLTFNSANTRPRLLIRQAGTTLVDVETVTGTISNSTLYVTAARYQDGATPADATLEAIAEDLTANSAAWATGTNAGQALAIGARNATLLRFGGGIAELIINDTYNDAVAHAQTLAYIVDKFGVTWD